MPASAYAPGGFVAQGSQQLSVKDYGAKGDGVTDDAAAIQAALNAAQPGNVVLLPAGGYRIAAALTVPTQVVLRGVYGRTYYGAAAGGSRLLATNTGQTTPAVTLAAGAAIEYVSVTGPGAGLNVNGIRLTITNRVLGCHVRACALGVDGNGTGVHQITDCDITENSTGLSGIIDSVVRGCYINANTVGIYLGTGNNDCLIIQNKVEFNGTSSTNSNILLYQCGNLTIIGNLIDRSGGSGIRANGVSNSVISGNMLRRNGAAQGGATPDVTENCHIRLTGCTGVVVDGNVTAAGPNDDGSGYNSPSYAVYAQGNTDCRVTGNALKGANVASFNDAGGHTNFSRLGNATTDYEVGTSGRLGPAFSGGGQAAAPLGAPTLSLGASGSSGGTFAAGTYYWKVTALNAAGETLGSNEVSANLLLNGTQALSWTSVAGATGYKVYRATAAGGESTTPALVTTINSGATTSYTDTGTATTAGAVPAANTTGGSVTVTLGPGLLALGTYSTGALYRVDVIARDTGTGARSVARVDVLTSREAGNAAATLNVRNMIGAAFAASGGSYNVTATTAVDGTSVTLTITNTTANAVQFVPQAAG